MSLIFFNKSRPFVITSLVGFYLFTCGPLSSKLLKRFLEYSGVMEKNDRFVCSIADRLGAGSFGFVDFTVI